MQFPVNTIVDISQLSAGVYILAAQGKKAQKIGVNCL